MDKVDEELLLALEVLVEGRPGDADLRRDVLDVGGVEPLLLEADERALKNRLASAGTPHADDRAGGSVTGAPDDLIGDTTTLAS